MTRCPLDAWIEARTGVSGPDPAALRRWQIESLFKIAEWARAQSPLYAARLAGVNLSSRDSAALPFTTPDDLRGRAHDLLCVSQDEVERVVTLTTSGTTGSSKRIFLTGHDLESTLDFFRRGMATFTGPGDAVLVLLPGRRDDCAAVLLARALEEIGVRAVLSPWPCPPYEALRLAVREGVTCLAALPSQLAALLAECPGGGIARVDRALTSGEPVSDSLRLAAARAGIEVYAHYGLTETGFGGGVECQAHSGYHLREADILVEIVDPFTGAPLLPGADGEVVLSTLSRVGMPLLRYRTGDLSRMLPGPCPCGSPLPRLGPVTGRIVRSSGHIRIQTPTKGTAQAS
ncbi:Phenylacetate-coenzyme A ligase [Fundidesulfovibrio magnetotacticus]|uniref:Phenylacetate-coenzyme A ligase n=1 Tax=Fundidesulfovibrio magnetotacticus TaxID=2730080 RepID=A0A6V8LRG3_9BACT|nr:AMP-binding protein [Fundidesulfovibrio magnetotacticus]GFK92187.1 Phenylacetate-coenzyme A ligase [Fundidesulfovibrio magnetotacticus]